MTVRKPAESGFPDLYTLNVYTLIFDVLIAYSFSMVFAGAVERAFVSGKDYACKGGEAPQDRKTIYRQDGYEGRPGRVVKVSGAGEFLEERQDPVRRDRKAEKMVEGGRIGGRRWPCHVFESLESFRTGRVKLINGESHKIQINGEVL